MNKDIENLISAIQQGIVSSSVQEALAKAEEEKKNLENMEISPPISELSFRTSDLSKMYNGLVRNLETKLEKHFAKARTIISGLLGDPIVMRPTKEGGLVAEMCGSYEGLLKLTDKSKLNVVAGVGFEPTTFRL